MSTASPGSSSSAVIGIALLGGPLTGAMLRDLRLANDLARRGYPVHLFWAMDLNRTAHIDPAIEQHWLFHGARLVGWPPALSEALGRLSSRIANDKSRANFLQDRSNLYDRVLRRLTGLLCDGVQSRPAIVQRYARKLQQLGITHLCSGLGMLGMWGTAACQLLSHPPRHLISFQGHELYLEYARRLKREPELKQQLRAAVLGADYPAIAVSEPYRQIVCADMDLTPEQVVAIPPGVELPPEMDRTAARAQLKQFYPDLQPEAPLLTYIGRQDAEKGIDLLLYAAAILRQRGLRFQLAVCGSSLFGQDYRHAMEYVARSLNIKLLRDKQVTGARWTNLLAGSHVVIYPSIIRETFGMVPVEALAHGTPAVVPDLGGAATVIEAEGHVAGLRFRPWDSGDLAQQLATLLENPQQYETLRQAARTVAAHYSVQRQGERVLDHLQLPHQAQR